jgi:ribosomal protein S18 acetylase RimI-like enzyme
MPDELPAIVPCPPHLRTEALALVLRNVEPDQRAKVVSQTHGNASAPDGPGDPLFVALAEGQLCGAAWGQRQPGNTALLWPPQCLNDGGQNTAAALAQAVVGALDAIGVDVTQMLLPARDPELEAALATAGFRHAADVLHLAWTTPRRTAQAPDHSELQFEPYDESQHARLAQLIERTYEATRDCPALNGARHIDDVIAGYRATGTFRPEHWLLVRAEEHDVGILLLADHPADRQWELVYMGVVPEARGRGWGLAITRHAQRLALRAGVERLVLAVDAANEPALAAYRRAGFFAWDRRTVYVRFRPRPGSSLDFGP